MRTNQKIPEGWRVKKLGETCFFFNGKAHENCVDENGKYVLINSKFISSNGQVCKRVNACLFPLIENDITIVMSDVPNGKAIAKCFLVNEADKYTLNQRIGCLRTKQAIPQYLVNIISRNKYFLKFDDGINQTNLRKDQILNCPLLLPPVAEQEKIAGILGTWDEAIEKLSDLIEQKKLLKKGLMQKLLTGKTRLPGFTQPWKEVKLGEIFNIKKGQGLSKDVLDSKGVYKCILYGELYTKYSEVIKNTISRTNKNEKITSNIGDILIPASTTTSGIDLANATALFESDVILGGDINILRAKKEISPVFFAYLLTHSYKFDIARLAQGITIVHLYAEFLKSMKVFVPIDINEQQAIADVLSAADEEIDLLNKKLEALKEQKKGLMQQLLTGQTRVKVN